MHEYYGYLDEYFMVTVNGVPGYPGEHSENGLLFTVVAMESQMIFRGKTIFEFTGLFTRCFIDGKLYRSPEPHPKPDSHDNWMACVLGTLITGNKSISRKLLWCYIKNFGYVNKEFIGRFLQLPPMLFATAFPFFKWLCFPAMWLFYKLQNPKTAIIDSSAGQLQFVAVSIMEYLYPNLGFKQKWLTRLKKYGSLHEVFKLYYKSETFPTVLLWKE